MNEKIALIYGTRPEFLKLFPLINEFSKNNRKAYLINTGQHDSMLTNLENSFGVKPDFSLAVQSKNFSNSQLLSKLIEEISKVILTENIQKIVAQGDTFTVLAASIVAFIEQRKFYHVEAGLRTQSIHFPFPEEYNRRLVSLGTSLNFSPTSLSTSNLLKENVESSKILEVGNTIVDMIQYVLDKENINVSYENKVFITAHRRENIGEPLQNITKAILELAQENPEVEFFWALHPNPNTRKLILDVLKEKPKNIILSEPLDYLENVKRIAQSKLIISDSGGIQEESPSLQKRILILRNETERPEVLQNNCGVLVGSEISSIKNNFYKIWNHPSEYILQTKNNPFGDGHASERIFKHLIT